MYYRNVRFPSKLLFICSLSRVGALARLSSAMSFTVEVMRNVKEEGNTFFNPGKHLSQTSLLLGDPREEVERVSPSVQGRRRSSRRGRGKRGSQKTS